LPCSWTPSSTWAGLHRAGRERPSASLRKDEVPLGPLAASYRKAKTMTEKLAVIALAVSVGSLLVSIASAVIAWRAKQQARKAATLGQRIEAINHVRVALHDLIQDGVVKTKTTDSIRNALHLSAVVFSGRIGRELEQAYATAYRLQDIDRLTSRDWDDNLDLRKALQTLIARMNEEAALVS
jgi:hypothetical protein